MKRLLATLSLVFMLLVPAAPVFAYTPLGDACKANGNQAGACQDNQNGKKNTITGTDGIIGKATKIVALIAGIAAVIIIIISGIMYATSAGDAQQASRSRSALIYAAVGLVVVALAQAVILFILSKT